MDSTFRRAAKYLLWRLRRVPPFRTERVQPHDILYTVSRDILTLPCVLRTRGSVKDVSGRNVKDVLGLDTQNAKGWGTRPLRQKQPTIAPLDLPFQCCHIVTRKAAATDTMNPVIPTRMSDFPLQSFC